MIGSTLSNYHQSLAQHNPFNRSGFLADSMTSELFNRISRVRSTNPYFRKDLEKAKQATKFIGRGSPKSSTRKYMDAAGSLANTGEYQSSDIIFVSAEGARTGRFSPNYHELDLAIQAGATFVTDKQQQRDTPYNIGEREVAEHLINNHYQDIGHGIWKKRIDTPSVR